ncbi:Centrosome and spindle pole-associated protein [Trichinella pseudospiralis]
MSSSSLLERKKAQWAKEKAEEQQWFPFGKPGGGAPLKAVFGNIRQNSSDYFANSLPAQEIHFNDGNALLLRRHSSEHDLRNRSVRIHLPYGVSKINHVDFDGSSSNPIKILPFPCSKCLNNEGRLVVSLAPCATCSDSETSTTLNPSLNDCQALELTDSSKICSKIENAGCSYTPMRALSQVDLRKSKHGGNGMKFVRPASDNLPFFVSSEAHINHQFVTPVGDMERISPILNSENFAHKRRSYITEPKNFEDLEEKQSKCSLHLKKGSKKLSKLKGTRETMANQRELNKWKKLKEIEELREKSVVESWEKARIEAAMIRKARIFQHASGSGIGETSNNSSSNAEIFDKSLNHSSALDDSSGCNTTRIKKTF